MTMLLCFPMIAYAQWEVMETEADELKGTSGSTYYVFTDPNVGKFAYMSNYQFAIRCNDGDIFNVQSVDQYTGQTVLIGLYNNNDQLLEKFTMWMDEAKNMGYKYLRTRNQGGMFNPVGQKGKVKKILKHLNSGSGYVRIVTALYNALDFDLKITPYPLKE